MNASSKKVILMIITLFFQWGVFGTNNLAPLSDLRKEKAFYKIIQRNPARPHPNTVSQLVPFLNVKADIASLLRPLGVPIPLMEETLIELDQVFPYLMQINEHLLKYYSQSHILFFGSIRISQRISYHFLSR